MIEKKCGDDIVLMNYHMVKEVVQDDYCGIKYEPKTKTGR